MTKIFLKLFFAVVIICISQIQIIRCKVHKNQVLKGINSTPNMTANYSYNEYKFPEKNDSLIKPWKMKQPLHKLNITNSTLV